MGNSVGFWKSCTGCTEGEDGYVNPRDYPDHVRAAAQAHTELCLFAAVVNIMESGDIKADSHAAAQRIIKICHSHQAACLARYDRAVSAANQ